MQPMKEATVIDDTAEMVSCEVEMERLRAVEAGIVLYQHEYGFLAFPRRSKGVK